MVLPFVLTLLAVGIPLVLALAEFRGPNRKTTPSTKVGRVSVEETQTQLVLRGGWTQPLVRFPMDGCEFVGIREDVRL